MDITLRTSTGIVSLDALLQRLVLLCEQAFPGRIRSYYLGGSHSDGTAVGHDQPSNSSDVDCFVIFSQTLTADEQTTFQRLVAEAQQVSHAQLDAHAFAAQDLLYKAGPEAAQSSFLRALIDVAGVLVYGDDLRPDLPPVELPRYMLDVIESGIYHLSIPRQRGMLTYPLETPLVYPLTYPEPADEFYGYELIPAHPHLPHGTRVFVALTAWIATFLLALESGHYAGRKSQSLQSCQIYLPADSRTQLAVTINDLCKSTWGYVLPDGMEDRERLRICCRETLALENEYLRLVHEYVLTRLQHGEPQERVQIDRILQCITYPDDEHADRL